MNTSTIDLNALPFDSEGEPIAANHPKREPKQHKNPFFGFHGHAGKLSRPPVVVHYQNFSTIYEFGRIEIPREPALKAYTAKRPLLIFFVMSNGIKMATRLEGDEIGEAVIAKRFMPHFPSCPEWIKRKNPKGFEMLVLRLPPEQWVPVDQLEQRNHRRAIELKIKN